MQNKRFAIILVSVFVFLTLLLIFIGAIREIVPQMAEYRAAEQAYQEVREIARPSVEDVEGEEPQRIDWVALRHLNPNSVGWIVVDGTNIDYPIVRGMDNDWYLHHTVTGERNTSGAIFMDHRNDAGFFDPHTLIFGHDMRNGTMFAGLHGFTGDTFRIYTHNGVLEYAVFSRRIVAADDVLYMFPSLEEHEGRIVTLSTCVFRRDDLRFVVQGILVEGDKSYDKIY